MAKHRRTSIREALEAATAGSTGVASSRIQEAAQETDGPENGDARAESEQENAQGGIPVLDEQSPGRSGPAPKRRGRPRKTDASGRGEERRRGRPKMDEGHRKTSTGYMTSAGQQIVRLTLHLTPEQKRNLKIKSLEAGFENASAYLIEKLAL